MILAYIISKWFQWSLRYLVIRADSEETNKLLGLSDIEIGPCGDYSDPSLGFGRGVFVGGKFDYCYYVISFNLARWNHSFGSSWFWSDLEDVRFHPQSCALVHDVQFHPILWKACTRKTRFILLDLFLIVQCSTKRNALIVINARTIVSVRWVQ